MKRPRPQLPGFAKRKGRRIRVTEWTIPHEPPKPRVTEHGEFDPTKAKRAR